MTALLAAIEQERMFQIKFMLLREDIDIEYCDKYGQTALIKSTFMDSLWKSVMSTKLLLQKKCEVNHKDKFQRTALTFACIKGNEYIVKLLLQTGETEANSIDVYGLTNLMYAVLSGKESLVSILVSYLSKYQITLDERTRSGFSAYMTAVLKKFYSIAEILKEAGASTDVFDFENYRKTTDWVNTLEHYSRSAISILELPIKSRLYHKRSMTAPPSIRSENHPSGKDKKGLELYHNTKIKFAGLEDIFPIFHSPPMRSNILKQPSKQLIQNQKHIPIIITQTNANEKPKPSKKSKSTLSISTLLNESIYDQNDTREKLIRNEKAKLSREILRKQYQMEKLRNQRLSIDIAKRGSVETDLPSITRENSCQSRMAHSPTRLHKTPSPKRGHR